jgi:SAM-dependent methyltransferase
MSADHSETVEQFTAQAAGFAHAHSIRDEVALELLTSVAAVRLADRVLDVACGPGLVVCAFAALARHATGIDVTPAMLEQARRHADELGLENVSWELGAVPPLPWPDGSFDVVVSRYAFHHLEDPLAVLREMVRVCTAGGRVVVCDIAPAPDKIDAFNEMDNLRDPSHVRALSLLELRELFAQAGLGEPRLSHYTLDGDVESLLARSHPPPGGADGVRSMFTASLEDDHLGVKARREGARIVYSYPIAVLAATVA